MRNIRTYIPLAVVVVVFLPSLLIGRYAGDRPLNASDIAFMLPLVAYFWPLLLVNKFLEDAYTYVSKVDKRNLIIFVLGLDGLLFMLWLFVLGDMPLWLGISTTAAFGFGAYDLVKLVNGLQKASDLNRIIWLHLFVPFFAAAALWLLPSLYTSWRQLPNPIAAFFIFRAIVTIADRQTVH